ncbi:MAG: HAD hydrolase-like protein [Butyricicoccus sp.]
MSHFIRYVLFDLDGTLTDSSEGITKCVAHALRTVCGIEVEDRSTLLPYIGPPLVDGFMTNHGVDLETARACTAAYRARYAEAGLFENRPYDGIRAALDELRADGYHLSVATSKPTTFSTRILEHFGLADCFDEICGATMDGKVSTKEQVIQSLLDRLGGDARGAMLMVGDRKYDVEGAHAFGIPCVGVLYGFGSREELEKAGADAICPSVAGLPAVIRAFESK